MGISRVILGFAAITLIFLIMMGVDAIQANRGDAWGLVIVCFALLLITIVDFFRLSKFRWLPRVFSTTVSAFIIHEIRGSNHNQRVVTTEI